jgi:hypothetical protein
MRHGAVFAAWRYRFQCQKVAISDCGVMPPESAKLSGNLPSGQTKFLAKLLTNRNFLKIVRLDGEGLFAYQSPHHPTVGFRHLGPNALPVKALPKKGRYDRGQRAQLDKGWAIILRGNAMTRATAPCLAGARNAIDRRPHRD